MKRTCLFIAAVLLLIMGWTANAQAPEPLVGNTQTNPTHLTALPGMAQAVFDYYFQIQTALARDSLEKVAVNAQALAEVVRKDASGAFSPQFAEQAAAVARANDLAAARQPFKAVSGYLIQYLRAADVPAGTVHEVHCPMKNLNWLQADTAVRNPFLGRTMLGCGTPRS